MLYDVQGNQVSTVYDIAGNVPTAVYDIQGNLITGGITPIEEDDYNIYVTEYQHTILQARDEWKVQYRADPTVIPLVIHTDQHGRLSSDSGTITGAFRYMGQYALKWNEISAFVGLGDVDISDYSKMWSVLANIPASKRIDIWGNHDLWRNNSEVNNQFVVDWDTNYFDNSAYGDISYAYSKKGIEYHVDQAHNVKYVCLAGWEIDKALGGDSHYVIGSQSMENIIDMLEVQDGYDIILLSHCNPWGNGGVGMSSAYEMCDPSSNSGATDVIRNNPVAVNTGLGGGVVHQLDTSIAQMLTDRNLHRSGTVNDSYGNSHSYDFTSCTGSLICGFHGHVHVDGYGWSTSGMLQISFDAMGYQNSPFYFVNVDRTNENVHIWKIMDNATYQSYVVPFDEPSS